MKKFFLKFCTILAAISWTVLSSHAGNVTDDNPQTKYYYIKWFNNPSNYITEETSGALVVMSQDVTQRQFWELVPTGNTGCYYIRNVATGNYIQSCNQAASSSSRISTGATPIEYYVWKATSGDVSGAFRLTSTDCANYDDTSKTPRGLNKDGASSNIIAYHAALSNKGSYWVLEETENLYDYIPFELSAEMGKPAFQYTLNNAKGKVLCMAADGKLSWQNPGTDAAENWYFVGKGNRNGGFLMANTHHGKTYDLNGENGTRWTVIEAEDGNCFFRPYTTKEEAGTALVVEGDSIITLRTVRSTFARNNQIYELPCGALDNVYINKARISGEGVLVPLAYPMPKISGSVIIQPTAGKPSSWYTLYTADQATVTAGYPFHLELQLNTTPKEGYTLTAYGDWNGDGIFETATGLPVSKNSGMDIPVPADAREGKARLRIRLNLNGLTDADDDVNGHVLDLMLQVVKKLPEQYAVTATSNDTVRGTAAVTSEEGDEVRVTATPRGNARFVCWKEGRKPVSTSANYTFTRDHNTHLTAHFSPNTDTTSTGINEAVTNTALSLSVKVSGNHCRIEAHADSPVQLMHVYHQGGRLLASSRGHIVKCQALPAGTYIVQVITGKGRQSSKLFIE